VNDEAFNLIEFQEYFGSEEACLQAVERVRWPKGFICPACGHDGGYRISTRPVWQCACCEHQTSITAGTLFHKTRIPLRKWFLIMYLVAQDKGGASALRLSKLLKLRYDTAWHILHKIRLAMAKRDEAIRLSGYIEIDEGFFGAAAKGKSGRGALKKVPVLVMVESAGRRAGSISMQRIDRVNMDNILNTVRSLVEPNQYFRSDGWQAYHVLRADHQLKMGPIPPQRLDRELHWVHIAISLAKRFILGTYHGVSGKYLQPYLDEFCYRFNRRQHGNRIFSHLLTALTFSNPIHYSALSG
jgi:transposase-like protein